MAKKDKPTENRTPAIIGQESAITMPLRWVKVTHHSPDHIAARYPYAAYGSNLSLAQLARRCPAAEIIGSGTLRGARIVFARFMGIVQSTDSVVPVGLYKLNAADVAALDRFEGLRRAYERVLVTIDVGDVAVRCFTYVKVNNQLQMPSDSYYATCLEGYNDWQMDTRRLRHAREHARQHGKPVHVSTYRASSNDTSTWYGHAYGNYEPTGSGTAESYRGVHVNGKPWKRTEVIGPTRVERITLPDGRQTVRRIPLPQSVQYEKMTPAQIRADTAARAASAVEAIRQDAVAEIKEGAAQNVYKDAEGATWRKDAKNVWRKVKE